MTKVNLLAVLLVLLLTVGCSNHTRQGIPGNAVPSSAGVPFSSPSATASQPVSQALAQKAIAPVPGIAEPPKTELLPSVAAALDRDKTEFCQYSQSADCDKDFMQAFHFRK